MPFKIKEDNILKEFRSPEYNYVFNKLNGNMISWGRTKEEDPDVCPYGPVIADIEVTTICHGIGTPCSFCYKSNTAVGENMSFETFKKIFDMLPKTLTQIAFGIGDIDANIDLFRMFAYCNENGVKPNLTINGARMNNEYYKLLVSQCGAVAVSHYDDDICFDAVKKLSEYGLRQVNIHKMLCLDTYQSCIDLMKKTLTDSRLEGLNAIVFLLMKPKGKRNHFAQLKDKKMYGELISKALINGIRIGFDSCSAPYFVEWAKENNQPDLIQLAEPCESTRQSIFISADGRAMPCSFCDDSTKPGIDVLQTMDFVKDVWHSDLFNGFRQSIKENTDGGGCAHCPKFNLDME